MLCPCGLQVKPQLSVYYKSVLCPCGVQLSVSSRQCFFPPTYFTYGSTLLSRPPIGVTYALANVVGDFHVKDLSVPLPTSCV